MQRSSSHVLAFSAALAIGWLSAGCTASPTGQPAQPNAQPEAEAARAKLNDYRRILVQPVQLYYSAEFQRDAKKQRYKIGDRDLERIRRYFVEAVEQKLTDAYPLASRPGPDVLRIDPVLVDAVVDKSAWLAPARDSFKKRDKLKLVALLRDSQSGAIVHRVLVDIRPFGDVVMRQTPLTYWDDMRFLLRLLATRVRWALQAPARSSATASIPPGVGS